MSRPDAARSLRPVSGGSLYWPIRELPDRQAPLAATTRRRGIAPTGGPTTEWRPMHGFHRPGWWRAWPPGL
jgi:hypothetical protein